jgi:hypothetical protein
MLGQNLVRRNSRRPCRLAKYLSAKCWLVSSSQSPFRGGACLRSIYGRFTDGRDIGDYAAGTFAKIKIIRKVFQAIPACLIYLFVHILCITKSYPAFKIVCCSDCQNLHRQHGRCDFFYCSRKLAIMGNSYISNAGCCSS